jgi:hypothetical protein
LGYDFNLGFEYPLYLWLDIGVDFINIPVPWMGAKLNHYISLEDEIWADTSYINIPELIGGEPFDENKVYYLPNNKITKGYGASDAILRPFKTLAYGKCRPFETDYFTLIPVVGFPTASCTRSIGPLKAA